MKKIKCSAIHIDKARCGSIVSDPSLRKFILKLPKIKPVHIDPEDGDRRFICFDLNKFPPDSKDTPSEIQMLVDVFPESKITSFTIELDYDHLTADEALRIVLPNGVDAPSSFETVGHIAHFNIRDTAIPWRFVIAKIIMDKNPSIRTVVNKLSISSKFRFLNLELIGGQPEYIARVKENGIILQVEYDKVYWNTRLSQERVRLLSQMIEGKDILCDAMGGIGAFAVHATKKGLLNVFTNDLNPASARGAVVNARLNHLNPQMDCRVFCLDARRFVAHTAYGLNVIVTTEKEKAFGETVHFVMNLPEIALEFVDAFRGIYLRSFRQFSGDNSVLSPQSRTSTYEAINSQGQTGFFRKVKVHAHCFAKFDAENLTHIFEIKNRISIALGGKLPKNGVEVIEVRDVAPNKFMFCAEFEVDEEIGWEEPSCATEMTAVTCEQHMELLDGEEGEVSGIDFDAYVNFGKNNNNDNTLKRNLEGDDDESGLVTKRVKMTSNE